MREAPPSVGLPDHMPVGPASDMFLDRPIAGFVCHPPTNNPRPAEMREIEGASLRVPARHWYRLQCYSQAEGQGATSFVFVSIVQYPNDAWARYDLRMEDGYQGVIQDRERVTKIAKQGRPVFIGRTGTYWASDDKILIVSGMPREVVGAFVDAYLTRYHNTLDEDFDLPYVPLNE